MHGLGHGDADNRGLDKFGQVDPVLKSALAELRTIRRK
jgi:hypothetical protein